MARDKICPPPAGLHENCEVCDNHFWSVAAQQKSPHLRYERQLSDQAATQLPHKYVQIINDDLDYLKHKLTSHGDLILARWTKKSVEKRANLLSTAAPEVFGEWPKPRINYEAIDDGLERAIPWRDIAPWVHDRFGINCLAQWIVIDDFAGDRMKLLSLLHVRTEYGPSAWGSYTDQPFAPPTAFSPNAMLQKAKLRLELLLDEIELMQTDPLTMQQVVQVKKASVAYDDVRLELRYNDIAKDVMLEIINRLHSCRIIAHELDHLCKACDKHQFVPLTGGKLPREVDVAMTSLGTILFQRLKMQGYIFKKLSPAMKTFKDRFTHYNAAGTVRHREKQTMDPHNKCDRIYWLVDKLDLAINGNNVAGLSGLFGMLEYELLNDAPARLIENRFRDQLTDIATTDELRSLWIWSQLEKTKTADKDMEINHEKLYPGLAKTKLQNAVVDPQCEERIGRHLRIFMETRWPKGQKDMLWLERATDFDCTPEFLAELEVEKRECELATHAAEVLANEKRAAKNTLIQEQTIWGSSADESAPTRRKQTKAKAARDALTEEPSSSELEKLTNTDPVTDIPNQEKPSAIPVKQETMVIINRM